MTDAPRSSGSALRRVVGNSLWLVAAEAGTRAVSLFTILYLTRTLAVAGMGVVEFGMAVFIVMQTLAVGGVDVLAIRGATRRPAHLPRLAGRVLLVGWMVLGVALVTLAVGAFLLPRPPAMRAAAVLYGLAAVFVPASLRFAFIARERAWLIALVGPLGQGVFLALCLLGVGGPEHVLRVPLFWMAAVGLRSSVLFIAFVREHGRVRFAVRRRVLVHWLRATLAVGAGSIARGLMTVVDVLVLGLLVAPEAVASYGVANKLPLFLVSLAGLVHVALFPTIARTVFVGDGRRLRAIQGDAVKALLGVALPGALCLSLVAEPLVVLLFTAKFQAAVPLFRLLVWRFPLAATSGLFRATLWARSPATDARIAVQVLAGTVAAVVAGAAVAGTGGAAIGMLLGEGVALALYASRAGLRGLALGETRWLGRLALAAGVVLLGSTARNQPGVRAVAGALLTWGTASLVANLAYVRRVWREMRGAPGVAVLPE